MKKTIKYILPLILLALVFTCFMIPSSAEDISYAVWSSEEAYLSRPNNPDASYSTNNISAASLQNGGYLLCYKDLSIDKGDDINLKNLSTTVIDLGGNTLHINSSITIGKNGQVAPTHLTVKNGNVIAESGSQAFKPQGNSNTVLDNVNVSIKGTGEFIYGDGFRSFTFKNSTLNINNNPRSSVIFIAPPLATWVNSMSSYDAPVNAGRPFKTNIVFDNSIYVDNSTSGFFIKILDRANIGGDGVSVTFLSGSSFNKIDSRFYEYLDTYSNGMRASLNIEKGVKFSSPSVPMSNLKDNIDVSFYNSVSFDGLYVECSEKTELAEPGYVYEEGTTPKLLFGFSGDYEYTHALCNYLVDIKLYDEGGVEIPYDYMGYTGFADGITINPAVSDGALYFKPDVSGNDLVYKKVLIGWSKKEDGTDCVDKLVVTENASYYATYKEVGPAIAVVYSDGSYSETALVDAAFDKTIDHYLFNNLTYGSSLVLYADASIDAQGTVALSSDVTLDLNGYTLSNASVLNSAKALFELNSGTLYVQNGNVNFSGVSFLNVDSGSVVYVDKVKLGYNTSPLFELVNGSVYITNSAIFQSSYDYVPAFMLSRHGGMAHVSINNSAVDINGAIFTHLSTVNPGTMSIDVANCESIRAASVFALHQYSADTIPEGAMLNISITGSKIYSDKVFDIPYSSSYSVPINATIALKSSYFTSDPRNTECGNFVFEDNNFIVGIEDEEFEYTVREQAIDVKFGMTLNTSFSVKVYALKSDSINYVKTYSSTYDTSALDVYTLDGKQYYVATVNGISASDVLGDVDIELGFIDTDVEYSIRLSYSPYNYLKELLSASDILDQRLAGAALSYIYNAYVYSSSYVNPELEDLISSEEYQSLLRDREEIPTVLSTSGIGNLSVAFTGASLYLSSDISLRFNLRSDFSGTLNALGTEYTIENGACMGKSYVEVKLSAFELYSTSVSFSGLDTNGTAISGEYNILDYLASAADGSKLYNLVSALYIYAYEAEVNKNMGVLPPYIETLPPMDVIQR